MQATKPKGEIDGRFSSPDGKPIPWSDAASLIESAEIYWLSTVRADGRPHVTPLIGVYLDGALHFCTGAEEQKARNLDADTRCILTTGCNKIGEGLDVVLEGEAVRVRDEGLLRQLADAYVTKYGEDWRFDVRDGSFFHEEGGAALVFGVTPIKVLGFDRGSNASQTRWRF